MENDAIANVLIIDDDHCICKVLSRMITGMGHRTTCSHTLKDGVETARAISCDVILLDVGLPDGNGLDILPQISQIPSQPEVIIMTGLGDRKGAEIAVRNGAWDYIQKSDFYHQIQLPLQRVLEYRKQRVIKEQAAIALNIDGIIGGSRPMKACYDALAKAANCDANVLVTGETGTGKELVARAIHKNSVQKKANMVVVDCAALPETLVESLLFGYKKGVYTGADRSDTGLVAQADGGTLFLDEIGELPLAVQKVFLRVLQERRYRPVGGQRELSSKFRLITATNRDLEEMVRQGLFRSDLLYRIRAMQIQLPPVRERDDDIKGLTLHYVDKICSRLGIDTKGISSDFVDALNSYNWPGNVRELIHTLETAIANNAQDLTLFARNLPARVRIYAIQSKLEPMEKPAEEKHPLLNNDAPYRLPPLKEYRRDAIVRAEKEYMQTLLGASKSNSKVAIQISGLSRSRFYALLKEHAFSDLHQTMVR